MKIVIYAQELLSVVLTPFVLWFSLPDCAPAIVDFFREFTIHVDSLGYVCSFAVFDFQRHGNVKVSLDLALFRRCRSLSLATFSLSLFLFDQYPKIDDLLSDLWGTRGRVLMEEMNSWCWENFFTNFLSCSVWRADGSK